jgi:hypothetical protein
MTVHITPLTHALRHLREKVDGVDQVVWREQPRRTDPDGEVRIPKEGRLRPLRARRPAQSRPGDLGEVAPNAELLGATPRKESR